VSEKVLVDLSSDERVAALCDLSYRAGLKAGWNYCTNDDQDGFARILESARGAVAVLAEHRQKGTPAAPAAPAAPVGEIVHWSNGGRTLKFVRMDFEAYPEGTKLYVEPVAHPDARALVEALAEIAAMEPEPGEPGSFMDDADFRYLKCLRKMQRIARAAIDAALAGKGATK